jgi:hypothetical protein
MRYDWDVFVKRLGAFPGSHRLLPPCERESITEVEQGLGRLPEVLHKMLLRFNGAQLFIAPHGGGEYLTIFGISTRPPLPAFMWAPDWYLDRFTPPWRAGNVHRQEDWALCMTNYGGLVVMNAHETIGECDTAQKIWLIEDIAVDEWAEVIIRNGKDYLKER